MRDRSGNTLYVNLCHSGLAICQHFAQHRLDIGSVGQTLDVNLVGAAR